MVAGLPPARAARVLGGPQRPGPPRHSRGLRLLAVVEAELQRTVGQCGGTEGDAAAGITIDTALPHEAGAQFHRLPHIEGTDRRERRDGATQW